MVIFNAEKTVNRNKSPNKIAFRIFRLPAAYELAGTQWVIEKNEKQLKYLF